IKQTVNVENSHYNSFQAQIHSQLKRDLQLQAAYTLSRAIDPAYSGGGNGVGDLNNFSNPYDLKYDTGRPSGLDRTHIAFVNFIYDIPFLRSEERRVGKGGRSRWA